MKSIALTLVVAGCCASPLFSEEPHPNVPEELIREVVEFTEEAGALLGAGFMAVDKDGDGEVSQRDVLRSLMSRGFARLGGGPVPEKRQEHADLYRKQMVEGDKALSGLIKADADGNLGLEEATAFFHGVVFKYAINRAAILDIDQDGKLTLQEVATGVPIRKDETVDDEGYTEGQRRRLQRHDLNNDGFLSSDEWFADEIKDRIKEIAELISITLWFDRLDKDGDESISRDELAVALPNIAEELPEAIPLKESIYWIRAMPHEWCHELAEAIVPPIEG